MKSEHNIRGLISLSTLIRVVYAFETFYAFRFIAFFVNLTKFSAYACPPDVYAASKAHDSKLRRKKKVKEDNVDNPKSSYSSDESFEEISPSELLELDKILGWYINNINLLTLEILNTQTLFRLTLHKNFQN